MLRTGSEDNCELHSGDSRQYCEGGRCLSVMTAIGYTAYRDEGMHAAIPASLCGKSD